MIKSINDLLLPPTIDGSAELFTPNEVLKRTIGGKLITRINLDKEGNVIEKWKIIVNYETTIFTPELQAKFYNLCTLSKSDPVTITFISPFTNEELSIKAKCTQRQSPKALQIGINRKPSIYEKAGATFEEI